MATTALKIGDIRIKIMTMTGEPSPSLEGKEAKNFLNIEMRQCDEDFRVSCQPGRLQAG